MSLRPLLLLVAPVLLACGPTGTVHDVSVALYAEPSPATLVVRAGDQIRLSVAPDGGLLTLSSADSVFRGAFPRRFDAQGSAGRVMFATRRLGPGDALLISTQDVPGGAYTFFIWDARVPTGRLAITVEEDPIGALFAAVEEVLRIPLRFLPDGDPAPASDDTRVDVSDAAGEDAASVSITIPPELEIVTDSIPILDDEGDPPGASDATDATFFDFQVEKPVAPIPGSGAPRYPEILLAAGVEGQVLAQFVVDTLGRVESGSFKVIRSDHELFSAAVQSAAPALRFLPAEVGGRKVKQLVQQPFVFSRQH